MVKDMQFKRNSRNTPVILLAQGNVNVSGIVDLSATLYSCQPACQYDYRIGGPGGFNAGDSGRPGFGPGGGVVSTTDVSLMNGKWIGSLSLVPIIGGSGGADYGGGGGGAITIASSASITLGGQIYANGNGGSGTGYKCGSGGAIRLVSNSITFTGNLSATSCGTSPLGVIRVEATQIDFRGSAGPSATLSPINPTIVSSASPRLTIVSVGGYSVPSYSGSRFDTVDLLLPNQLTDPINVVVQAVDIPSGTQVQVGFPNGGATATSTTCILTGGPRTFTMHGNNFKS